MENKIDLSEVRLKAVCCVRKTGNRMNGRK